MMTAAKMVLRDWQRINIPFFVPIPRQENDSSKGRDELSLENDKAVFDEQVLAARKAIADVISSQQLKDISVQGIPSPKMS